MTARPAPSEQQQRAHLNRMIAIPDLLRTDDGRRLRIRKWMPSAQAGEQPTVMVEAVITDDFSAAPNED